MPASMQKNPAARHPGYLAAVLYLAIFLNGFEAGGYQACLQSIGEEYTLSSSLMGVFASVQLVACLIAPLVFGPIADKRGKKGMMLVFLAIKVVGCLLIIAMADAVPFVTGIFMIGLSVSTVQYISIAALADAYPATSPRKLGFLTGMYSLGAVLAPLLCGWLIGSGMPWRSFFAILAAMTCLVLVGVAATTFSMRETPPERPASEASAQDGCRTPVQWKPAGIAILCLIMFVYVGVESGIAYFLNSFVGVELGGSSSYLALSLFWLAMIPSRLLCGAQSKHRGALLLGATIGVSVLAAVMGALQAASTAIVLSFVLGFFSGAVYPCVLSYNVDFAGERTATATGLITAATGLGGALITLAFGWIADALGIRMAFVSLGAFMLIDVICVFVLLRTYRRLAPR